MPRRSDPHIPGACYHVTLRGAYQSHVYFAPRDRGLLISILTEVLERFAGKLHCYSSDEECLLLLVQVGEEPLGRMMLRVARRYAHQVHERQPSADTWTAVGSVVNRLFDIRCRNTACLAPPNLSFSSTRSDHLSPEWQEQPAPHAHQPCNT